LEILIAKILNAFVLKILFVLKANFYFFITFNKILSTVRALFLFLFLLVINTGKSQTLADTLSLTTNFKGYQFIHQGKQIKADSVMALMENNELALDEFMASREAYIFGNVFAIIGSALIVYPFLSSALGNEPNYGPAFAGVCFIGISVPIFMSYNKKTESSINKYNNDLVTPPQPTIQSSLNFGTTPSGIGFSLSFWKS